MFKFLTGAVVLSIMGGSAVSLYKFGLPMVEDYLATTDESSDTTPESSAPGGEFDYENPASWSRAGVYPMNRSLMDAKGRSAEFVLLGRTDDRVYVKRQDNYAEYTIYLDTLSKKDQSFIEDLPNVGPSEVSLLHNKIKEAREIIDEIAHMRRSLSAGDKTRAQFNNVSSEIARLERQLSAVRLTIEQIR